MKLNRNASPLSRTERNKQNENWEIIETNFNNVVSKVSDEALQKVIDGSKLNWLEPVESFSSLPGNASEGDTRMTRNDGKVYRYNGTQWQEIQQIDVGPVNELDSRLTSQLAQKPNDWEVIKKNEGVGLDNAKPDLLAAIENKEGETAFNLLSIPRDQSVTAKKTTFFEKSRNLFDGEYYQAVFTWDEFQGVDSFFIAKNGLYEHDGRMVIFPIEANEVYSVKVFDPHDMFRIGVNNEYPNIPTDDSKNYVDTKIVDDPNLSEYTFTNTANGQHGIIYVTRSGQEPRIQIEKGNNIIEYVEPYFLPEVKEVKEGLMSRTITLIEKPITGYPTRLEGVSVVWIGPNEPMQAEPFDEWRQTEGFTYHTDFSEYSVGAQPEDWSVIQGTPSLSEIIIEDAENVFTFRNSELSSLSINWDKASNDEYKLNNEIYIKGKISVSSSSTQALAALHRSGGNSGNEYFLFVGMFRDVIRVTRKHATDSSSTILTSSPHNIDPSRIYHQRSRIDGDRIRAKIWQDGQPEPKDWMIDIVDGNPINTTEGLGVYTFSNSVDSYVYEYGVGTGGMRAPTRSVR